MLKTLLGILVILSALVIHPARAALPLTVEISGVGGDIEQNIRSFLSLQALHEKPIERPGRLRYLHNKADAEIRKALQPFGYYRPQVEAYLERSAERWLARYEVTPGPVLPIGTTDLQLVGEARLDSAFLDLLAQTPVQAGAPLVHADYEALKRQLQSLAAERGYYQAQLNQQRVEVDLDAYQARVILHFDSGPRFRVGQVSFTPTPLSDDFLIRYVPFETGSPVSSSELIALQTALVDSDYFQRVEVRPIWEEAEGTEVPVEIALDPKKQTRYRAGLGYGTDTGARGRVGVTRRWVNALGHQFDSQLLVSQIRTNLAAEYALPGRRPQTDRYAVRLSLSDEDSDSIDARNHSLGISWQHQSQKWRQIVALDWQQEEFRFGDETQESEFLIPRVSLARVSTTDRLNVRHGYRLSLEVLGGSDALLSDTDFVQSRLAAKHVYSFTDRARLLTRLDAGITAVDNFDRLPATLRFFAGGDSSVRGYDYQSLGPKDVEGTVIGGPNLVAGSLEVDYRIREKWGVAAFIDSGNAFEDYDIRPRTGIGVGIRWYSPIGPVRADLAFPQSDDASGFNLHFTLGPDL